MNRIILSSAENDAVPDHIRRVEDRRRRDYSRCIKRSQMQWPVGSQPRLLRFACAVEFHDKCKFPSSSLVPYPESQRTEDNLGCVYA